ncbi:MAG TPA: hypothetical protein VEZ90_02625 [Blastocatellia bacterium]|nr:hypothetical protein [Blastocatellia bacterium]
MEKKAISLVAVIGLIAAVGLVNVGPVVGSGPGHVRLVNAGLAAGSGHPRHSQDTGAGCDLTFAGSARKLVKLRSPDQTYKKQNDGTAISVADFLSLVCTLDSKVTKPVPATKPMEVEKLEVTIDAFIIAMKQDPDNDFHIQIADTADASADQIIVEVPPGDAYCDARQNVHQLFVNDGGESLTKYVFDTPPKVEIVGYLFLDSAHGGTKFCTNNGGRGIHINSDVSHVKGLWEIHPVISLKSI